MTCCADFSSPGARAFSPVCFSASVDRPAQHRPSRLAPSVASARSCRQFRVGDALAGGRHDHRIEPREGLALDVRAVGFAETVQHEPSGLLRDSDFLGQLQRGNAFPRRDE